MARSGASGSDHIQPEEQPHGSVSTERHRQAAPATVSVAVLTISDTRTEATDTSGQLILEGLRDAGHRIVAYQLVHDDPGAIGETVALWCADPAVQVVLTNGGTGISHRDTTYDVIDRMLEKRLDGFGELFRSLSFAEIGSAAMLSRATAGVCKGTLVMTMPGSTNAVRLAMEQLILPELGHLVFEVTR